MKQAGWLILFGVLLAGTSIAKEKYVGENPHTLGTAEWQRYHNCMTVAGFAREFADDKVMQGVYSRDDKVKLGEIVMGEYDSSDGESVETLLAKKGVELGVNFEKQPEKAFQEAWQYCMKFTLKEHYYYDVPLKDVPSLTTP
ncbi:hypothetical protein [Pleionea litopenaei]|uniref:Uncharacterized protein n=1 Tax=Pleionea litopenaei TaxID=3070815 RepID=A0AA51X6U8_9GAMM|nr:hypothetical protein [Pleionea sp. HL-JVS1]WMS87234.1 hypothetical protein Q9312_18675 [Pleionea sp. HL-JVS1]